MVQTHVQTTCNQICVPLCNTRYKCNRMCARARQCYTCTPEVLHLYPVSNVSLVPDHLVRWAQRMSREAEPRGGWPTCMGPPAAHPDPAQPMHAA